MKFELIREASVFRWRLLTNSGQVVCESISFPDKTTAWDSIQTVRKWSKDAPVVELEVTEPADWKTEAIKVLRKKNERNHENRG